MGDYPREDYDDFLDPEYDLLGDEPVPGEEIDTATNHAMRTAPLITGDAYHELTHTVIPQRALYGRVISQYITGIPERLRSPKVYINTNTPFSALVCGVQGSGKSHSTSVLLESCLMSDGRIGTLPAPLSALVFHFDTAAGGGLVQPCEAAYLSTLDPERGGDAVPPPVRVLVVPTYLNAMKRVYAGLPRVEVEPLLFSPEDISGERLLAMMKVDENTQMPLYMESIMAILRSMQDNFDYISFRRELSAQKFNPGQKAMLNLRLSLLDSCLNGGDVSNSVKTHFRQGQLTIVDLSSPFMDGASACGFFDMILGLFVEAEVGASGKLVVLDEAHKYLSESQTGSSARLTESLLTVIRQQRHLATRVVISTQEPTVVPSKFLDLCSIIIAHRFSSPKWLRTLAEHVSAADSSIDELFEKIVSLQTGQAIIFAPNGLCMRSSSVTAPAGWHAEAEAEPLPYRTKGSVGMLGQGYLVVRSRLRLTLDGGHSLLAVTTPGMTTRLGRVSGRNNTGTTVEAPATSATPASVFTPSFSNSSFHIPQTSASTSLNVFPTVSPTIRMSKAPSSFVTMAPSSFVVSSVGTSVSPSKPVAVSKPKNIIKMVDGASRFAPMVKWVESGTKSSPWYINRTTIKKRFMKSKHTKYYGAADADIERAIDAAIQMGLLEKVPGKPAVRLIAGAHAPTGRAYSSEFLRVLWQIHPDNVFL